MIPTRWPRGISKLTSCSAQNASWLAPPPWRRNKERAPATIASRSVSWRSAACAMKYRFARPWTETAIGDTLDDVREIPLGGAEVPDAPYQQRHGDGHRKQDARPVERPLASQQRPAETLDHAYHRVER